MRIVFPNDVWEHRSQPRAHDRGQQLEQPYRMNLSSRHWAPSSENTKGCLVSPTSYRHTYVRGGHYAVHILQKHGRLKNASTADCTQVWLPKQEEKNQTGKLQQWITAQKNDIKEQEVQMLLISVNESKPNIEVYSRIKTPTINCSWDIVKMEKKNWAERDRKCYPNKCQTNLDMQS